VRLEIGAPITGGGQPPRPIRARFLPPAARAERFFLFRDAMKVLTRYLLRAHIGPFLFAFVALTGVILINTLAKEMANLAGKGLPLRVIVEFFVLSLPANIALTLPMSVLVAVLYTFSQLAAENEITALKASGVDLKRVVAPLVVGAALIAAGMVWFNDRVLPEANYRWRLLMVDVAQTSPLLALREQTVNPIRTGDGLSQYYLQARHIEAATGRMRDVAIFDVSAPSVNRTIYADSGTMALNRARTDLLLTLYDGQIREVDFQQPETFQQMGFERQILRMQGVSQRLERSSESNFRTDRDMTTGMMQARIDSLQTEVAQLRQQGERMLPPSVGTREDWDARVRALQYQIREYQVEVQKKYSIAAATLIFVLIGVPLALRFPRGGVGMVIAVSLGIFAIYYVGLIGGETLADEGYVAPIWSMWIVNVLFGIFGLVGLARAGREQSSMRGGGWGELPRWLRLPAQRRSTSQPEGAR
jgi:lipopolysaccharide export system permease protein